MNDKEEKYKKLIKKRKSKKTTSALNDMELRNYSEFPYKNDFVDGWEQWHSDLDANIMIVGQDYTTWQGYEKERGDPDRIKNKFKIPTNIHLAELLALLGKKYHIDFTLNQKISKLFFTNAVIGLKDKGGMKGMKEKEASGMQKSIKKEWASYGTRNFLKPLIEEIVQPKNIIALGQEAFNAICSEYCIKKSGTFKEIVENKPYKIPNKNIKLFAVYHCGGRRLSTNRTWNEQVSDWKKIKKYLN